MKKYFFYFMLFLSTLVSCKKENDSSRFISIDSAYPLAVGKTFWYRLDSTVPVDFGKSLEVHSYLAKDSIESSYIDPTGKTAFRIYRYITDTLKSQPWQFCATHTATLTANSIEYTENNLRFTKLVNPISYNTSWKGNSYINTTQGVSPYYYFDDWNYRYENIEKPFTCIKQTFDTTYTVLQNDEQSPSSFDPTTYNDRRYGKEVYAKGVGLIYKELLFYIWQITPKPAFQDDSYGIKLNLIDYK
jgi:hypothetical protein